MCTVTFIPRSTGYYLAMNRDEQLSRVAGLPPTRKIIGDRMVVSPSEPSGGTWIALNDQRVSFALINWYSIAARATDKPISRGKVVNAVSETATSNAADAELAELSLQCVNPFRLIGIFPEAFQIAEWRWDLKTLTRKDQQWKPQQWISSGFDETTAQRIRGETFRTLQKERSAGTLSWLRRLHRSHSPEAGPFSTCMHRSDAATVSYTEIAASARQATLHYEAAAPCCGISASSSSHVHVMSRAELEPAIP